jgi:hypothetical protein
VKRIIPFSLTTIEENRMKTTRNGQYLLNIGGIMNVAVGLVHIGAVFIGPAAFRYLRAGERIAKMADAGSIVPTIVAFGLASVFLVFALYAFSAAGTMRKLPFLRPVVLGIGIVYVLRGVLMIPTAVFVWMQRNMMVEGRDIVYSAVAALIGLLYLAGTHMESTYLKNAAKNGGVVR